MGDNTTTYIFRGRELERMEGSFTAPAPETLEPLPPVAVYDPESALPTQLKANLQQRIAEFEKSHNFRFFVVIVAERDFEDYAWRLLDTIRFGAHSGTEVVLVFSSGSKRSTVLFGPSILLRYNRDRLSVLSTEAVPADKLLSFPDHVAAHVNALLKKLEPNEAAEEHPSEANKILYGGQDQALVDGTSSKASQKVPAPSSSASDGILDAKTTRVEDPAWRTITLALIFVLVPSLIIGAAIVFSTLARRSPRLPAELTNRVDLKPLSSTSTLPERRVKSETKTAESISPIPRVPQVSETSIAAEKEERQARPGEENLRGLSKLAEGDRRLRQESSKAAPIEFAEGEEEKIGELLAALKLLQEADGDMALELLDLIRSLLRELKEIAASVEVVSVVPRDSARKQMN